MNCVVHEYGYIIGPVEEFTADEIIHFMRENFAHKCTKKKLINACDFMSEMRRCLIRASMEDKLTDDGIPKEAAISVELTKSEIELLVELQDCQGQINDLEYSTEQKMVLMSLAAKKLVALRWVITPAGEQAAKTT